MEWVKEVCVGHCRFSVAYRFLSLLAFAAPLTTPCRGGFICLRAYSGKDRRDVVPNVDDESSCEESVEQGRTLWKSLRAFYEKNRLKLLNFYGIVW